MIHAYMVGTNPNRGTKGRYYSACLDERITNGTVVYSVKSATDPDIDNEIAVYLDENLCVTLGYVNVDCLFGIDMPGQSETPVEPVVTVVTEQAYDMAASALGVDLSGTFLYALTKSGIDIVNLVKLATFIQEQADKLADSVTAWVSK